tara:strand:+ start:808 stop:1605 length:798 start_codon:yes stop_codon:yes gene_type:complete
MSIRPIGIFDSGLGGLTVVKSIKKLLPNESILYFGDTARLPYGLKSKELVIQYSTQIADFLIKKDVKMIIIACNTATAMALEELRNNFKNIPIIGVIEPGSVQASVDSINKKIGIIGTVATIKSKAYERSLKLIDKNIKVFSKDCPLFVPFVEEGMVEGGAINLIVEHYLSSFQNNIDTMILGCTHYPLLEPVIRKYVKGIKLVDSASAVAKQANKILNDRKIKNSHNKRGTLDCFVTDLPRQFEKLGRIFLGEPIKQPLLVDDF